MGRSQRHYRYREGFDAQGRTAYQLEEPSLKSETQQRASAIIAAPTVATPPAACTVAPVITGTATVGQTLTRTTGTWAPGSPTLTTQWYRASFPIPAATGATYVLTSAELGRTVWVRITSTEALGVSSEDSARVGPVA